MSLSSFILSNVAGKLLSEGMHHMLAHVAHGIAREGMTKGVWEITKAYGIWEIIRTFGKRKKVLWHFIVFSYYLVSYYVPE